MDYEKKITEILQDKHVSEEFRDKLVSYFPELAKSEDEEIINRIKHIITMAVPVQSSRTRLLEWLDKQRKQVSAEWSDHDSWAVNTICYILNQLKNNTLYPEDKTAEKCIEWLDNLKYRVQPKQEWSEEEKRYLNGIQFILRAWDEEHSSPNGLPSLVPEYCKLLDSLLPQNHWRPTEEQLKALYDSVPENVKEISEREMLLDSLYQDLKKL